MRLLAPQRTYTSMFRSFRTRAFGERSKDFVKEQYPLFSKAAVAVNPPKEGR